MCQHWVSFVMPMPHRACSRTQEQHNVQPRGWKVYGSAPFSENNYTISICKYIPPKKQNKILQTGNQTERWKKSKFDFSINCPLGDEWKVLGLNPIYVASTGKAKTWSSWREEQWHAQRGPMDSRAFFLQVKGRTTLFHSLVYLKGRVELRDLWGCQSLTSALEVIRAWSYSSKKCI